MRRLLQTSEERWGGTPAPVKPGESEEIFQVRDAGLEEGGGGVGGKLLPDVQRCLLRTSRVTL